MANIEKFSGKTEYKDQQESSLPGCWKYFEQTYPTDEACIVAILENVYGQEWQICGRCQRSNTHLEKNYRALKCDDCGHTTWPLANTFFCKVRRIKAYVGAIWLLQNGFAVSSFQFHKLANIAQSTALNIFKKVAIIIENTMERATLPSTCFDEAIGKRSKETPARLHPTAEGCNRQEANQISPVQGGENAAHISPTLDGPQRIVYDCLDVNGISFDTLQARTQIETGLLLATLTMLELADLIVALEGNRFARKRHFSIDYNQPCVESEQTRIHSEKLDYQSNDFLKNDRQARKLISEITHFLQDNYHAVSRKYLQLYIATFWYLKTATRKDHPPLIKCCSDAKFITITQLAGFISPVYVKVGIY